MKLTGLFILISVLAIIAAGCRAPAPQRVPVPQTADGAGPIREREPMKPLPPHAGQLYGADATGPGYDDVPLITQAPPEQRAFVQAYRAVGSPRVVVFVNRTIEGQIIPVANPQPLVGVEVRREASSGMTVERTDRARRNDGWQNDSRDATDTFKSDGPGTYRETREIYLAPGEYDEVAAKRIDYDAIENVLTDWLGANGQVTLISPQMAKQRLTDEQYKELQEGRPTALRELAERLDADVLVQAQAKPTRQTPRGLEVRLLVEAMNTRGGESLARAFVDVPPPLEKQTINAYTRFLARKTMNDLTNVWSQPAPRAAPTTSPAQ